MSTNIRERNIMKWSSSK